MKSSRLNSCTGPPHKGGSLAVGCALGLLAGAISLLAQSNEAPQIRFFHLRIKDQTVSLVDTTTRPGVLKPRLNNGPAGLQYELVSAAGISLWKGAVPDSALRHFEYEDPPGSGNGFVPDFRPGQTPALRRLGSGGSGPGMEILRNSRWSRRVELRGARA
jgi:hypothetical protein